MRTARETNYLWHFYVFIRDFPRLDDNGVEINFVWLAFPVM
jgi:hypothetical protein